MAKFALQFTAQEGCTSQNELFQKNHLVLNDLSYIVLLYAQYTNIKCWLCVRLAPSFASRPQTMIRTSHYNLDTQGATEELETALDLVDGEDYNTMAVLLHSEISLLTKNTRQSKEKRKSQPGLGGRVLTRRRQTQGGKALLGWEKIT